MPGSCALEGVFEDSGAVPPYGWASANRRRFVGPTGKGCQSTITLRFTAILYGGDASRAQKRKNQRLLYSIITGTRSTTSKREQKKHGLVA